MNPFFFGSSSKPLFGAYHPPLAMGATESAVLICPPIGREYIRTHWALRRLADQLASKGAHVFRFDYYGTGDSAGNYEEGTVEHWHNDIQTAVTELQDLSGLTSVSLIGLRMGALLAATSPEIRADKLIMWDPVLNGHTYLKQQFALNSTRLEYYNRFRKEPIKALSGELLGYPLSTTMRKSIENIDLLSDFNCVARNALIISTQRQDQDEYRQIKNQLSGELTIKIVEDIGNWNDASALDDAFLPNATLKDIINSLMGG